MSCSKIFSGDLPELTYDILKYHQNDFSTLHSCILINRFWCRLAIPLLWEDPFSIPKNNNFITTYLHNLNDDDFKSKLSEYKININLLPTNTLFNYPSFLKYLNTQNFIFSTENWVEHAFKTCLEPTNLPSIFDSRKFILLTLITIFIENEVNLHTFEIVVSKFYDSYAYLDYILEIILQNLNFLHNIRISNLYIWTYDRGSLLFENHLLQVINSLQDLKKIIFSFNDFPIYQSLLSGNCSNTLNTIIFYEANLTCIDLDKMFNQLNVLENVHIINCSINTSLVQQITNLTKPFKLKSLYLKDLLNINSSLLLLLFQKFGDDLENFGYRFLYGYDLSLKQQLFELIIKYCKNIKFFDLHEKEMINYQFFNLIENIKQNLNHLTIDLFGYDNSIILQNLGQSLPSKLKYLNLSLRIKSNDLEVFLKNSQNTFIEKLLIHNVKRENSIIILPYIKEYIMKKKRVKYLAISNSSYRAIRTTMIDLFLLKDEVKEFELYNIKVRSHTSLAITLSNCLKII
jgi:hypothetical protein